MGAWNGVRTTTGGGLTSAPRVVGWRAAFLGSAVALLAIVGVGTRAPTRPEPIAASADPGPRLSVSSLRAGPGEAVTIAGTDCDRQAQLWLTPAPGTGDPGPLLEPTAVVTPDPHGRWETVVVVPADVTEWRLEVGCFDEQLPPDGFVYPSPLESTPDA